MHQGSPGAPHGRLKAARCKINIMRMCASGALCAASRLHLPLSRSVRQPASRRPANAQVSARARLLPCRPARSSRVPRRRRSRAGCAASPRSRPCWRGPTCRPAWSPRSQRSGTASRAPARRRAPARAVRARPAPRVSLTWAAARAAARAPVSRWLIAPAEPPGRPSEYWSP
ncbi:MAG: hypothetical protein J3K34DRAFT_200828 [Monoraphidium minutum]|nr:MAG: hypothetical protein J3K34DRAFT_200828 [Monoraphidium minutum]